MTDAFFCSENHAFLYFPEAPQFLADQYEATVDLVLRMTTVVCDCNDAARSLAKELETARNLEPGAASGKLTIHAIRETEARMQARLDDIRSLQTRGWEFLNLRARASISLYQDHGALMGRVIESAKITEMAELLTQQLGFLDDAGRHQLDWLEAARARILEERLKFLNYVTVVGSVAGLIAALKY